VISGTETEFLNFATFSKNPALLTHILNYTPPRLFVNSKLTDFCGFGKKKYHNSAKYESQIFPILTIF
jgi:hypothetical protein